jgi:hypothetical protein
MGEMRNAYKILAGKPEGKGPRGKRRCRWEDNIRMDIGEMGWEGVKWTHLSEAREWWWTVVNTVMNLRV